MLTRISACAFGLLLTGCTAPAETMALQWETIFDGETLTGWTPKMHDEPLGEDRSRTFRAGDGILSVDYGEYDAFDGRFGILFFDRELHDYRLRFEYRFVGEQSAGAPEWAFMNSGAMLHTQPPASVKFDFDAPVSIEAQLLASHPGEPDRTTGNVCTPGTHVEMDGVLRTEHCINSAIVAKPAGEWTLFEADVRGGEFLRLYIDGALSMEMSAPVLDTTDFWGAGYGEDGMPLTSGYIALQAESHGVEFRNIQLLDRDPVE